MVRNMDTESFLEEDAEYRDFIESISVSQDELAALITVPGIESIDQARAFVRGSAVTPASSTWLGREKERFARNFRHFMTGLSLTLMELRHGRNHRHT